MKTVIAIESLTDSHIYQTKKISKKISLPIKDPIQAKLPNIYRY